MVKSNLTKNPVASVTGEVKKLDKFMPHLLKESNQLSVCTLDTTFAKIQTENTDVMGPLSQQRYALESAALTLSDEADFTIKDLLNLVQQAVLFLGKLIILHRIKGGLVHWVL